MSATVGPLRQVAALLSFRLATVRGPRHARVLAGLAVFPVVAAFAAAGGTVLPRAVAGDVALLLPTAWLLFTLSAMTATATGAGGRRLLPREQSVAFLVSPAADHLGAIVLTPLSVAWFLQAISLVTMTSWVTGASRPWAGAQALTLLWIVMSTVVAQAFGWAVELARLTRAGVWALRAMLVAGAGVAVVLMAQGRVTEILDRAPTQRLVRTALNGFAQPGLWWTTAAGLVVVCLVAWPLGIALLSRLSRRPSAVQAGGEARRHLRRADSRSDAAALWRMDRAQVWRSAPLRRGLVVLALVPGGAAAATALPWPLLTLLPGLVASGAGLLFGVNAFALDSGGAVWRAGLPGSMRTMLLVRLGCIGEVCLVGSGVAVLAATARAGTASAAQVCAVVGAWIAASSQVVAWCGHWSVHRPYAAALRDARDQPAPPAAMAGYSARLAVSTTFSGLLFWAAAQSQRPVTGVALATAVVAMSARRVVRTDRYWQDPVKRARVVFTVAGAHD